LWSKDRRDGAVQQTETLLRLIPNAHRLLENPAIAESEPYRHEAADAVRQVLAQLRQGILAGEIAEIPNDDEIVRRALELAGLRIRKGIRRCINGTGVMLHSNLGRAPLSKAAAQAAMDAAMHYCTLEYDLEEGKRGSRTGYIEQQLKAITGCEASLIVNNNAAAVLLALSAVASGGNVIVSRGELVEIGGGFRVPDIIAECGCTLREVGTTNRTRLSDYADAIDADTRALLKVHTGNFKIVGFTHSVTVRELSELGAAHNIPIFEDIGSGALADIRRYAINDEPLAIQSLKSGADIVSFSGDKLLGGPQCGVLLGKPQLISAMKAHPLYRALRVDKMTIAALEATLRIYSDPILAEREIPVLSMLSQSKEALRARAEKICEKTRARGGNAEILPVKSAAGGGAVPGLELDSFAVSPPAGYDPEQYERALRALAVPIIGRIEDGRLLLDVRTINDDDLDYIAEALSGIAT
jgi:L-seryl-tRNA(Ser) seleniumtransferase